MGDIISSYFRITNTTKQTERTYNIKKLKKQEALS